MAKVCSFSICKGMLLLRVMISHSSERHASTVKKDTCSVMPLPSYVSKDDFAKLSAYSQRRILELIAVPEEDPEDYDRKAFTSAGYESWTHYTIVKILEDIHQD